MDLQPDVNEDEEDPDEVEEIDLGTRIILVDGELKKVHVTQRIYRALPRTCPKCKKEIGDDVEKCPHCGIELDDTDEIEEEDDEE